MWRRRERSVDSFHFATRSSDPSASFPFFIPFSLAPLCSSLAHLHRAESLTYSVSASLVSLEPSQATEDPSIHHPSFSSASSTNPSRKQARKPTQHLRRRMILWERSQVLVRRRRGRERRRRVFWRRTFSLDRAIFRVSSFLRFGFGTQDFLRRRK